MVKKKIKDLTKEEAEKICNKHYVCNECPLDIYFSVSSKRYCIKNIIQSYKEDLEREIEVEDSDK